MPRRDECLVSDFEEAVLWLAEFEHTIKDDQVLKVIECLQFENSCEFEILNNQIEILEEVNENLEERINILKEELEELKINAST